MPSEVVIGSSTELFLRERVAKKVVSKEGRIVIFNLYTLMIPFLLYGCFSISIQSERYSNIHDGTFFYDFA